MFKRKCVSTVLAVFLVFTFFVFFSFAEEDESIIDSGTTGDLSWTLTGTETDMVLTITGSGFMPDYNESSIPWSEYKTKIKNIVIEEGISSVGNYAFYSLNKLEEISLPSSLRSIGSYSFVKDSSIIEISLPDGVASIGAWAFEGCSSLKSITIPDSVTSIGAWAFEGCSSLTSITIPNNVTSLEFRTFSSCSSLTSITIPDSVTSIGDWAFSSCGSLTNITIPNSVTSIGFKAFSLCSSLTNITIPESVTSIGYSAFDVCSNLTSITIPDSVTSIGDGAFSSCSRLKFVFYGGSEPEWRNLSCDVVSAIVHYNSTDHSWNNEHTIDNEATCSSEGSESIHCSVCDVIDESTVKTIPKTDHAYGDWSITQKDTCTTDGMKEKVCTVCGDKVTEMIPATDHKWNSSYTVDTPATHSQYGQESIHCSVCDAIKEDSERPIPKNDKHEIKQLTKAATCSETGMKKHYECTVCHKMFKDAAGTKELTKKEVSKLTLKKKKHSFKEKSGEYLKSAANCTKPAVYYYTCKMCHQKGKKTYKSGKKLGHDFVSGSIKKATGKKDGKIAAKCSRCGKTNKGVKIPKASKIVVLNKKSVAYVGGGSEKDLIKVVVKNSKYPLGADEYTVSYGNPVYRGKKSKGTVTVTFKPECKYYSGSLTLTYKITKAPKK